MQLEASKLYNVALEQCIILQQQVIELRALYMQTKEELEELKSKEQNIQIKES